jgi:transposase-like protein
MESMARPRSYSDEFRERAVRLVREWRAERGLSDGGLTVVAAQLGLHRKTAAPVGAGAMPMATHGQVLA